MLTVRGTGEYLRSMVCEYEAFGPAEGTWYSTRYQVIAVRVLVQFILAPPALAIPALMPLQIHAHNIYG